MIVPQPAHLVGKVRELAGKGLVTDFVDINRYQKDLNCFGVGQCLNMFHQWGAAKVGIHSGPHTSGQYSRCLVLFHKTDLDFSRGLLQRLDPRPVAALRSSNIKRKEDHEAPVETTGACLLPSHKYN